MYHGDIRLGDTIDIKFTSRTFTTGAPGTLSSSPVISAYPGNSTTEVTGGITLSVDFDGRTGLNNCRVVATSGNGYATATNYTLVITTGTVGGVSVVGECIGSFSIEARSALMPTTAARTLVVDASGLADANTVKVGPTASGTAQTARDLGASVLISSGTGTGQLDVTSGVVKANTTQLAGQTVTAAAGVTFPTSIASPTNITAGTITTTTNLTNAATVGDFTATMKTSIGTAVAGSAVASVTGNVGGNVTGNVVGSVGSVASGGISSASFAAGAINAAAIATNAIDADAIATDAVTEIQSGLSTLDAAGVRAAVGLASANLDTQLGAIDDFIDTEVAAIKTTTDHLATALELDSGNYRFTTAALAQAPTGGSAPTAASIADAVWDEQISDHQGAGSTGLALNDAGGSGNPWNAVLEGSYTGGDLLRITAAVAAGKTTIVKQSGGAEVTFRDVTDSSDIVVAEMTKSNRTTVTLTP